MYALAVGQKPNGKSQLETHDMNGIPRREFIKLSGAVSAGLATWPLARAGAASPVIISDMRPVDLRCDNIIAPMEIGTAHPNLSWILQSDQRNQRQAAYRVLIASSPQVLAREQGDVWDSGKTTSDQQLEVTIPVSLEPTTAYDWKVMIWDQDDKASAWSPAQSFETGFFDLWTWPARWFNASSFDVNFARREFLLASGGTLNRARAYVASTGGGCNSYELRLNGQRVGNDLYAPGPCEPSKAMYSTFDITKQLHNGLNTVALLYNKRISLQMLLQYTDGSLQVVATDNNWKGAIKGPYIQISGAEPYGGGELELYDARQEWVGWEKTGFDETTWKSLAATDASCGLPNCTSITKLKPRLVSCKIIDTLKPVAITRHGRGNYIVDFGQEVAGHVRIAASGGRAGDALIIHYSEMLDAGGKHVDQRSITRDAHHQYIFKDNRPVIYEPQFFNVGFRYVEVNGYPGKLTADKITSLAVASDVVNGSLFECSDPTLNRLQRMATWSFLSNLQNIPTDCPGRERRGWTADCHAVAAAECINFDMRNFFDKWLDDHAECQYDDGWIPVELPMSGIPENDPGADIKWPASSIFIPWDVYNAYGNRHILEKHYPMMRRYLKFLQSIAKDNCLFDRLAYDDWGALEPANSPYLGTAYYYYCATLLAKIAGELSLTRDAAEYLALASMINTAIQTKYRHDGETVYYDNNTQSANAHALGFGIVPEADRAKVLKNLIDDYQGKGHNTTGFLGIRWVLPVLSACGRNDIAYSYIRNPKIGGWKYFINHWDATTMHEFWNGTKENSFDHAFLAGSLSEWLYQDLAGIASVKPGYREIRCRPYIPADVSWARAQINTVRGWVKSEWKKQIDGSLMLSVTIPANTFATVHVPATRTGNVTESRRPAADAPGVKFLRAERDAVVYKVGSGTYVFEVHDQRRSN